MCQLSDGESGMQFNPGREPEAQREPAQRVLISTQYERKIDLFEARLANIEGMLRELTVSVNHSSRSPSASAAESSSASNTHGFTGSSPPAGDGGPDIIYGAQYDGAADSTFEGDSSIIAQAAFASELLENAVTRTLPHDIDSDMRSALSSLHQIVNMQNRPSAQESRFANAKPIPKGGIRELPMPPAQAVVAVLRDLKETPLMSFTTVCTFAVADSFTERCRKVYFAPDDYSLMAWGVVNAGLYFLFQEKAIITEGAQRTQMLEYQALCRDNLETALTNLPLLMPARRDSIEVLVLGAFYSIEISKYTLARDLNSIAATLCQTLGYHRIRPTTPEHESKTVLFWAAYLLDKALSIRSGRAPAIQDYDITVPRELGPSLNLPDEPGRVIVYHWITFADFNGKAYEQLYSPAALARPPEQRAESARQLVQMMLNLTKEKEPLMRQIRDRLQQTNVNANSPFSIDMAILSDELLHWASLTLAYRAIPSPPGSPSTFNPECIHAARRAFECHFEYMALAGDNVGVKTSFVRWNVLYIPFTPVIVLFCHVVETSDRDDLRRLADFVDSLQPMRAESEGVEKLHRICHVLHDVASLCVRARAQRQQDPQLQDHDITMVGNNIDMYLSRLGFMPQYNQPMQPGATPAPFASGGDAGAGMPAAEFNANWQANQLGNWFSGNTHIMGLLEEDLSEFEPRMWPPMGGNQ
ncbi:Protein STB5 [Madurella mycetomatis]|uniref:Protein STB5 n=1 Tax=Madurella mycetomatis TaxID=100816 RepID=A0A175VWT4_9PEZI|nr:Protein STB5 [Madurella mycetomatis]